MTRVHVSMKLLAVSLLLCVSAVCIGWSNAGSYRGSTQSHGHHPLLLPFNMKTRPQELPQPHKIQKRQVSFDCEPIFLNSVCTSGAYQEYAELYQTCDLVAVLAQGIRNQCSLNSMGSLCLTLDDSFSVHAFEANVSRTCSSTVCSSECRTLLANARNDFGCCINFFNESSTIDSVYSYSLWSSCGVETITLDTPVQICSDATFDLKPAQIEPGCTSRNLYERLIPIFCRRKYVEDLRQKLSESNECIRYNDTNIINSENLCNANQFHRYCATLAVDQNLTEAISSCSDTSTCEPRCIATLSNISNTVGCCFNDRYNNTRSTPRDFLSFEFWSRCNLNSPGFCEEFLNDAATIIKASSIALASAVTLAAILHALVVL